MENHEEINASIAEYVASMEKEKLENVSSEINWREKAEKEIADRKNVICEALKVHTREELFDILEIAFNLRPPNESNHCELMKAFSGIELEVIAGGEVDLSTIINSAL